MVITNLKGKKMKTLPSNLTLPRIYKKSKTGAIVICDISTAGDTITVTTGQLDGAMQDHHTKCFPMNIGRSNETSAEEQAQKEALAKQAKKIKAGYVLDASGKLTVELPMKVKKYQDQIKNIQFPCYVSPKLDGVNGTFKCEWKDEEDHDQGTTYDLYSRGGDLYPGLPHLYPELDIVMTHLDTNTLNGEIYKHGMHLQDITSAVKKPNSDSPQLEFHVFEIPDNSGTYKEKLELLNKIDNSGLDFVKIIRAIEVNSHEEIKEYFDLQRAKGYEGIIVRNADCVYEYNVRSSQVFKYKEALDAEYKIVGYKLDKKGHPVFRCITSEDDGEHEFHVKLKGTDAERKRIAENADQWVGQWLNIEFENYSKDRKPLKPVGIGLRDCDKEGNPVV